MKLLTFSNDDQRNLIIQFPVFVQLYTQQHLTLYQMETDPVPIVDENKTSSILYIFESKEAIYRSKFRHMYFIEKHKN